MTIAMPSLTRDKNGEWFSRKGIPADVRDDYQRAYGLRQEERFRRPASLSAGEAKAEFAGWLEEVERRINSIRAAEAGQSQSLSTRQIHVLIGRWYEWFVEANQAQPSPVELWDHLYEQYEGVVQAVGGLEEHGEGEEAERAPWHQALVRAKIIEIAKLPSFLAAEGVKLDHASSDRLVDVMEADMVAALAALRRQARGDYSPDHYSAKFPIDRSAQNAPGGAKLSGWNAWDTFAAYVGERKPAASTVNRWRGVLLHLNDFLEQKDIALVTAEDAVAWKDRLVSGGAGGRTIKEIWIAAAKRVFGFALDQQKIAVNPFVGVKVAVGKTAGSKGELTDEEALEILRAALAVPQSGRVSPINKAKRWVPWICAYTGARPGEITQLRKEDIQKHPNGFWTLRITDEAGTVKVGEGRTVVLHEHLIEQGFVSFVEAAKPGPLFYDPAKLRDRVIDPLNPPRPKYVQVRQKLADWVRNDVGLQNKKVSPNHAWRHSFARRASRVGIERHLRDAFCGWSDNQAKAVYETPTINDLADAISKFPRYPIETPQAS